jgi:hypothetical protein
VILAERAGEPIPPREVEGPVEARVQVMDVVVLGPLREGREEHPERRGGGEPQRELVAAMAHEVHIRHRPQQVEHVDGIPRRPLVNVGDDAGVEHEEREHEVKGIAIGRAEDGEVPEGRVVPPVDFGVQALGAVQQGVDGKEVGVVEHHNRPRELETPQNVTREFTSAYKPMSAGREQKKRKKKYIMDMINILHTFANVTCIHN